MKRIAWVAGVVIALFSCINISCAQKDGMTTDSQAVDFSLPDLSGTNVSLKEVVPANKATLLVFWATWCPYCVKEIPDLKKMNAAYQDKGLKILAIDLGESAAKVQAYAKENGLDYTILLDKENKVASQYGVVGIPTSILINSKNMVEYRGTPLPPDDVLPKK